MPSITKQIIFIAKVSNHDLDALGHLTDIATPAEIEKNFPKKDPSGNEVIYQPVYVIICTDPEPNQVRFIIKTLQENKMIPNESKHDINSDAQLPKYLSGLSPSLFLYQSENHLHTKKENLDLLKFSSLFNTFEQQVPHPCAVILFPQIDDEVRKIRNSILYSYPIAATQIHEHIPDCNQKDGVGNYYCKLSRLDHLYFMGLYPLNCGIILKDTTELTLSDKAKLLLNLDNKKILRDLFKAKDEKEITQAQAEDFLKKNLLVPVDMKHSLREKLFFQTVVMAKKSKEYDNIIFFLNQPPFSFIFNYDLLAEQGFETIIKHHEGYISRSSIPNVNGNRNIHIFTNSQQYFNQQDYKNLFKIAQLFGGAAGDTTLQLTLSNSLILFEDKDFSQIKDIIKPLILLAQEHIKDNKQLLSYLELLAQRKVKENLIDAHAKEMAKLIDDKFIERYKELVKLIQKNYNFYPRLKDTMEKAVWMNNFYLYHMEKLRKFIAEENYSAGLNMLREFDPSSPDLRRVVLWCIKAENINKYGQLAAFIDQYVCANQANKQDYFSLTSKENPYCEDMSRLEGRQLDELAVKFGFDKLDFKFIGPILNHSTSRILDQMKFSPPVILEEKKEQKTSTDTKKPSPPVVTNVPKPVENSELRPGPRP